MLKGNLTVKLNKNIIKRYEHNLNNGILFLYDVETENIWLGNESSNDLIRLIDGQNTLEDIYLKILPLFDGYSYDELIQSFDSLIIELLDKKFLECDTQSKKQIHGY